MLKNALWLFGIATLILVLFLPSYRKMADLRQKNQEYEQEILDLKKKRDQLKEEKRMLEEDPAYLEKVAREKMGLVKEGEVVYKLMPANQVQPPKKTGK